MRSTPKTLLLTAGIVVFAICAGATAIHAWQSRAGKVESKPEIAKSDMSSVILERHNNAHLDNLPVQSFDGP